VRLHFFLDSPVRPGNDRKLQECTLGTGKESCAAALVWCLSDALAILSFRVNARNLLVVRCYEDLSLRSR